MNVRNYPIEDRRARVFSLFVQLARRAARGAARSHAQSALPAVIPVRKAADRGCRRTKGDITPALPDYMDLMGGDEGDGEDHRGVFAAGREAQGQSGVKIKASRGSSVILMVKGRR